MSTSIAANAMSDGDKRQAREVAFEYAVGDATSTRTSRVASGHHIGWVGGYRGVCFVHSSSELCSAVRTEVH